MNRVVVVLPFTPVTATVGMRPLSPSANIVENNRVANLPSLPARWLQVHPQPRRRVYLHNHSPLLFKRPADVVADHVHAGYIQPDHPRGFDGPCSHLRMNLIGNVGRRSAGAQIRIAADEDH